METQEKDGKGCCEKKCCGGKALAVIGLLALGGLGGFVAGKHCQHSCPVPAAQTQTQPQTK
jgi:hypothetical protein